MRNIDTTLADRLDSSLQTFANNANPAAQMRIQRRFIPLHDEQFIERSRIVHLAGLTDSDVAVCHPKFGKEDEEIWVAYIRNDILHIKWAKNTEILSRAEWNDYSFSVSAIACSIAFDSIAKHNPQDIWEFVTDEVPWVFWVTPEGKLKAKLCTPIGQYEHELALANVTDVSAVRGPSGEWGNWNMGLTVFFVMAGGLYYRQYIDGEWCDAEVVNISGLNNITISKIKAFNTWDHRVGVQILTSDNRLYELFSYTEGIGTRGTEHIQISDISTHIEFQSLEYLEGAEFEHIHMNDIEAGVDLIYGLSAIPLEVINTDGETIQVTFDYPNTAQNLVPSMFNLVDSNGNNYICHEFDLDGTVLTLSFDDFDLAIEADNMTLTYTKPSSGGLMSPARQTDSFTETFVPTGLVHPPVATPTFSSATNTADGMTIIVTMTQDLLDADFANMHNHFGIDLVEYEYVPLGDLEGTSRTVSSVTKTGAREITLVLDRPNISSAIGNITINYDGLGGLKGYGGPTRSFVQSFTPTGLTWKGHQNDVEHIELNDIETSVTVTPLSYHDTQTKEHLEMNDIETNITLINIHDL